MVRLVPMADGEFRRYLEAAIPSYAQAHIDADDCEADEALALAQADYDNLLPRGLATQDQYLFSIVDGDAVVGMLWFELRERKGRRRAFLYDFVIAQEHRRKGYGKAAMAALEEKAAALGASRINLNVMGWNRGARALYEGQGFNVTGIGMTKHIAPGAG